jgi:hypothetical protein
MKIKLMAAEYCFPAEKNWKAIENIKFDMFLNQNLNKAFII